MSSPKPTIEQLQTLTKGTLVENLGITFLEIGEDFIKASMPVDQGTIQPYGILHGGASVALAETLGSLASQMQAGPDKICVGVEINANHLKKAVKGQTVYGTTKPIRVGITMHVWSIEIADEGGALVCISRLTVAIRDKKLP